MYSSFFSFPSISIAYKRIQAHKYQICNSLYIINNYTHSGSILQIYTKSAIARIFPWAYYNSNNFYNVVA